MATPSYRLDGQSLDVAGCWRVADPSDLFGRLAGPRGGDTALAQRYGVNPHPRVPGVARRQLTLGVWGRRDKDGNAHADQQEGLQANLDALELLGKPKLSTNSGVVALRQVRADASERETLVHVAQVDTGVQSAATLANAILHMDAVEGVWRDTTATSASATDAFPLAVSNPGSADQFDLVITLSGDATSVTLSNSTWGPATDLTVAVDLSNGDVTVDTDELTATQNGSSVIGSVSHSTDGAFPMRWLPLLAGVDNSIGVSHDGSTLTVSVEHYARWL